MPQTTPIVFVVDDDVSVRESLESLIRFAGWQPETYASAHEFLARPLADAPSCLVLDVSLPDVNGLDRQKRIARELHDSLLQNLLGIELQLEALRGRLPPALQQENRALQQVIERMERVARDGRETLQNHARVPSNPGKCRPRPSHGGGEPVRQIAR